MNDSNIILQGLQLMLTGMSMVFIFLSVLVFCTGLMEKLFSETRAIHPTDQEHANISDDEIAAISAAVHRYRKKILNTKE